MATHRAPAFRPSHTGPRIEGPTPKIVGPWGPPRKRAEASRAATAVCRYSAKRKMPNFSPVYSTMTPETSSLSASGMSKGIRLASASEARKKTTNAASPMTGRRQTSQP